jgi:hypothetical protein
LIAIYIISQNISNSSSNELAENKKDSALNSSGGWVKANQSRTTINEAGNTISNSSDGSNNAEDKSSSGIGQSVNLLQTNVADEAEDSVSQDPVSEIDIDPSFKEADKTVANAVSDKKENVSVVKKKKGKVAAPAELETADSFSGTLYEGYSFCSVLRAYKFPGQVSMAEGRNYTDRRIMKTISCTRLENISNLKAVWLKGKTSKKMTISIKEGFKNILLIKPDGRKLTPDAISHYYPGLGVISDYTGKFFEMSFKEKVELILFFKDVEDGDKMSIDGVIEAVIKTAP